MEGSSPVVVIEKIEYHNHVDLDHLTHKLNSIIQTQTIIMGKLEELQQAVADLQTSLDDKQAQLDAAIKALEQTIADLQALLASGATSDQLQGVIDSITSVKTDLEATPTA